ncbi:hypothetical protein EJ05DRAFT_261979 [Pseudovirgaria hyperparasitica]|uniref:Transmembrane protein n=1 Tax=Pseudovirgaria hyperparasitica TaxID=470096 RepID=A0A6A6WF62_9PEZI|nr:uncharacterized protein EJ05DRAFT_261979 [Pseudovirgaria hyperparasitica]KAF2761363.1 hypothetical protein EJ05DRAFT_261979 [Pseudovirgaria hyperparasitica]
MTALITSGRTSVLRYGTTFFVNSFLSSALPLSCSSFVSILSINARAFSYWLRLATVSLGVVVGHDAGGVASVVCTCGFGCAAAVWAWGGGFVVWGVLGFGMVLAGVWVCVL